MVKNLSQLKKILRKGTCFEIIAHCCPGYVGQKRKVTVANTQGFYSIVPEEPGCKVTLANNGKGSHPTAHLLSAQQREGLCPLVEQSSVLEV